MLHTYRSGCEERRCTWCCCYRHCRHLTGASKWPFPWLNISNTREDILVSYMHRYIHTDKHTYTDTSTCNVFKTQHDI